MKRTVVTAALAAFMTMGTFGAINIYASPMSETELDGVDFARNGVGRLTIYTESGIGKTEPTASGDYSSSSSTQGDMSSIPEGVPTLGITETDGFYDSSSSPETEPEEKNTGDKRSSGNTVITITTDSTEGDGSSQNTDSTVGTETKETVTQTPSETTPATEAEESPENQGEVIPPPNKKKLDLEGVDRPLTQKYITQYQTKTNIGWLVMSLNNSAPYRPYIQKKLAEYNMPKELQYLPIIESNFKNTAVSSSGATGMWQFMANSMAPMLSKNEWYDERRDPWKATDAAVRKLLDNYEMFKDWPIAIAAYNCGAGAMRKLVNANPGYSYWDMAENNLLRTETALYVAKLVAVSELIENAEYYGLLEVGIADKQIEGAVIEEYDFAKVTWKATVGYISELTGISVETLNFLNPALLKDCTPAEGEYNLRVPAGKGEEVTRIMKENAPPVTFLYTVEKGDSLWGISRKYGVTVSTLCNLNEIDETSILSIGQSLVVPIVE